MNCSPVVSQYGNGLSACAHKHASLPFTGMSLLGLVLFGVACVALAVVATYFGRRA